MTQGERLAEELNGTREWTLKLLTDISGDDWTFQPGAGLGHVLFLCGHMACSQHLLIHVRCLNQPLLEDAFTRHFPIGQPVEPAYRHNYPEPGEVLRIMAETHARTLEAVRGMSDVLLGEAAWGKDGTPHPHYKTKGGAVAHCNRHEAFHAGQIATIRRLRGKPFLR